jgi:hypothetical protein
MAFWRGGLKWCSTRMSNVLERESSTNERVSLVHPLTDVPKAARTRGLRGKAEMADGSLVCADHRLGFFFFRLSDCAGRGAHGCAFWRFRHLQPTSRRHAAWQKRLFNVESGAVEGVQEPGEQHRVVYEKRPNLLPTGFLGPAIAVEPGSCSGP